MKGQKRGHVKGLLGLNTWDKMLKPSVMATLRPHQMALVVVIGLALAGGVVLVLWSKKSDQPVHLKIVRMGTEQGKPVVFFRVEGDANLRILIHAVEKVTRAGLDGRYDLPVISKDVWAPGQLQEWGEVAGQDDFWAPSQTPHWAFAGQDFGVLAPTNVPIWKLRVTATKSVPSRLGAFKAMPRMWSFCTSKGRPLSQIAKITWKMGFSGYTGIFETNVFESEPITNALAITSKVTK